MGRVKLYYFTEEDWKELKTVLDWNSLASRLPHSAEPQVMYLSIPKKQSSAPKNTEEQYLNRVNEWFSQLSGCELQQRFPHFDVEKEKARLWLIANPKKRKSNLLAFLTNWMLRSSPANRYQGPQPVIRSL